LIIFEWKIEALKGTAKVLYCQYGLPRHLRIKWYSKYKNKSKEKNSIALQRLKDGKFTKRE
jgi:hypothetical protein